MYPALIPPGAKHVHPVVSAGHPIELTKTVLAGASLSSLLVDFRIRSGGASEIQSSQAQLLPVVTDHKYQKVLIEKYLLLNCISQAYAPLWKGLMHSDWHPLIPIRNPLKRLLTQIEIDVVVAIAFGIDVDELCMIYRTQFPVMRRYDEEARFDRNGRQIPKEILRKNAETDVKEKLTPEERTWVHPHSEVSYLFEYPFRTFDREEEIKRVYKEYTKMV